MKTIVHISDIHFGRTQTVVRDQVLEAFSLINPDLVIISGDLTQRATKKQYGEAKTFLEDLSKEKLQYFVIPGNHDIEPLFKPISRIRNPYKTYKKYISEELEPTYIDDEIAVSGINTVRSRNISHGSISSSQIQKTLSWFESLPAHLVRIIVTHHPFDLPLSAKDKRVVSKRHKVIECFSKQHISLYLSGHYHRSSNSMTSERNKIDNYAAIAVQAGTLSTRQRGEGQSFNVIRIDKVKIDIDTYLWDETNNCFKLNASNTFNLSGSEWKKVE